MKKIALYILKALCRRLRGHVCVAVPRAYCLAGTGRWEQATDVRLWLVLLKNFYNAMLLTCNDSASWWQNVWLTSLLGLFVGGLQLTSLSVNDITTHSESPSCML